MKSFRKSLVFPSFSFLSRSWSCVMCLMNFFLSATPDIIPPSNFLLAIILRSQKREKRCRKSYFTFLRGCCGNRKHHNEALIRMSEWEGRSKGFDCKWKMCFVSREFFSPATTPPSSMKFHHERSNNNSESDEKLSSSITEMCFS